MALLELANNLHFNASLAFHIVWPLTI